MIECDWCGSPMRPIGGIETGMARGLGRTWLCERVGCGHEVERVETQCAPYGNWYWIPFPRRCERALSLHERSRWRPCVKGHVGQCRGQVPKYGPFYRDASGFWQKVVC